MDDIEVNTFYAIKGWCNWGLESELWNIEVNTFYRYWFYVIAWWYN